MSRLFSIGLYYTSFAPLWLSVVFIDVKSIAENSEHIWTEKITISCILLFSLISLCILLVELCANGKEGTNPCKIESAKEEKTITSEYLLSYILPLFAFDFTTWDGVTLFMIFFLTIGFLCVKHNYFTVNVVLEMTRFKVYNCCLKNEDGVLIEKMIISHKKLNGCIGDEIYLKSLNNDYSLNVEQ